MRESNRASHALENAFKFEIMNKKYKAEDSIKIEHLEGLLKAEINILRNKDINRKLFGNKNMPLNDPKITSKMFDTKKLKSVESQALSIEHSSNQLNSKRSSISTLYNETTSFKQKTRPRADTGPLYKSQSSVCSGNISPKSKKW